MADTTTLTDEQKKVLEEAFDDLDIDKNEVLDKRELRAALQIMGQNVTEAEWIEKIESVEEQSLNKEQFVQFVQDHIPIKSQEEMTQDIIDAFAKFDTDTDTFITKEEFRNIMCNNGDEKLSEEEANQLLANLDTNADDKLEINEIARFFCSTDTETS